MSMILNVTWPDGDFYYMTIERLASNQSLTFVMDDQDAQPVVQLEAHILYPQLIRPLNCKILVLDSKILYNATLIDSEGRVRLVLPGVITKSERKFEMPDPVDEGMFDQLNNTERQGRPAEVIPVENPQPRVENTQKDNEMGMKLDSGIDDTVSGERAPEVDEPNDIEMQMEVPPDVQGSNGKEKSAESTEIERPTGSIDDARPRSLDETEARSPFVQTVVTEADPLDKSAGTEQSAALKITEKARKDEADPLSPDLNHVGPSTGSGASRTPPPATASVPQKESSTESTNVVIPGNGIATAPSRQTVDNQPSSESDMTTPPDSLASHITAHDESPVSRGPPIPTFTPAKIPDPIETEQAKTDASKSDKHSVLDDWPTPIPNNDQPAAADAPVNDTGDRSFESELTSPPVSPVARKVDATQEDEHEAHAARQKVDSSSGEKEVDVPMISAKPNDLILDVQMDEPVPGVVSVGLNYEAISNLSRQADVVDAARKIVSLPTKTSGVYVLTRIRSTRYLGHSRYLLQHPSQHPSRLTTHRPNRPTRYPGHPRCLPQYLLRPRTHLSKRSTRYHGHQR